MNEAALLLKELIALPAGWVKANLLAIATAFTTALLVIYGDNINRAVKLRINRYPFLVRTLAFVALCSFGYGLLTVLITPSVAQLAALFRRPVYRLGRARFFLGHRHSRRTQTLYVKHCQNINIRHTTFC